MAEFEVTGLRELDQLLKQLPVQVERNVMRGAMRAGQKVFLDGVKQKISAMGLVDTGELLRSVRIRFKRKSEQFGWIRSYVVAGNKKAFYAHWLEYGTASYYTGGGRTVGRPYKIETRDADGLFFAGAIRQSVEHPGIKPQPFMRPVADSHMSAAIEAVVEYMNKRIPREIARAAR